MRTAVLVASLIAGILTQLDCQAVAEKPKIADWRYMAPIVITDGTHGEIAEFALTPAVHEVARGDLADLRVFTISGTETGYVVQKREGRTEIIPLKAKLYNQSFLPGEQSSVTADFGTKALKNKIKIQTTGTNFRRKVRIEGSDDGETWGIIRDGAFLFRVQGTATESDGFDKSIVEFPNNDQRYLRITVFRGPEDPEVVEIQDVQASREIKSSPEIVPVPVVTSATEEKERFSEIILDLGFPNMPLYEIGLDFSDSNFFRHLTVEGRNRERRAANSVARDAKAGERTFPEPWTRIGSGTVFRFLSNQGREESLTLRLSNAHFRYVRIRINNFDDPPLHVTEARVSRLISFVSFPYRKDEKYALYVGNPNAIRPVYDVGHYIKPMKAHGIIRADLGSLTSIFPEKALPWSERHQGIIWVALLAMVAALGLIVYRMARGASPKSDGRRPTA
jgi:hypothetical protein